MLTVVMLVIMAADALHNPKQDNSLLWIKLRKYVMSLLSLNFRIMSRSLYAHVCLLISQLSQCALRSRLQLIFWFGPQFIGGYEENLWKHIALTIITRKDLS